MSWTLVPVETVLQQLQHIECQLCAVHEVWPFSHGVVLSFFSGHVWSSRQLYMPACDAM